MNTARRIAFNFLSLTSAEVISKILQIFVFIYLARAFGKDGFGIFSFGLSFAFIIVIFANFGLSTLLVREISRNKRLASKYLSNALISKIFLSILTFLLTYVFLNIMDYTPETKIVAYIMVIFAVIQSYTDLFYSIFQAFEKMYYDSIIKVLRMIILTTLVYYAIKNNMGLVISSLIFPLTEIVILLIASAIVYTKFTKISFNFNYEFSKSLLKKSSLFSLTIGFAGIYTYIDSVMLSKIRSTTEVGIYAAAANIIIALIFIPMMYGNAIYPVISRFFITSKNSIKSAYGKSFKYMLILGLPISAGLYILSDKIIPILYGSQYIASVAALSILSWYLFLRFLNVVSGFTLSSINKQSSRVLSQGIAVLVNVILNLIFIPLYGFIGAAIATVIAEIAFFIIYMYFISKYGLGVKLIGVFIRPVIATAIMIFSLSFIENLFVAIVLGGLVYIIALFALGTIDKEDRLIFKKVMKNI